eukprot:tig00000248_g21770.t1
MDGAGKAVAGQQQQPVTALRRAGRASTGGASAFSCSAIAAGLGLASSNSSARAAGEENGLVEVLDPYAPLRGRRRRSPLEDAARADSDGGGGGGEGTGDEGRPDASWRARARAASDEAAGPSCASCAPPHGTLASRAPRKPRRRSPAKPSVRPPGHPAGRQLIPRIFPDAPAAGRLAELLVIVSYPLYGESWAPPYPLSFHGADAETRRVPTATAFWAALCALLLRTLAAPPLALLYPRRLPLTRRILGFLAAALYPFLLLAFLGTLHFDPPWARPRPLYAAGAAVGLACFALLAASEALGRADYNPRGTLPFSSDRPSLPACSAVARSIIPLVHVVLRAQPLAGAVLQACPALFSCALAALGLPHQRSWANAASAAADAAVVWASGCAAAAAVAGAASARLPLIVGTAPAAALAALVARAPLYPVSFAVPNFGAGPPAPPPG